MTEHTPGPWRAECSQTGDGTKWWRIVADGKPILQLNGNGREADACLIAAAPEHLAALQDLVLSDYSLLNVKPETLKILAQVREDIRP